MLERAEKLVASGAPIVGFTTTFQQNAASIAVAQEIKRLAPHTMIVLGGANCESTMGAQLIKTYDCLDAVISGEADWSFPDFVQCVKRGESPAEIAGLYLRGAPAPARTRPPSSWIWTDPGLRFRRLLPTTRSQRSGRQVEPMVMYETARGCWYGEKRIAPSAAERRDHAVSAQIADTRP